MGSIYLYNADRNFLLESIKCGLSYYDDVNSIEAGTKTDSHGIQWTVTRTGDTSSGYITLLCNHQYTSSEFLGISKSLGFSLTNYLQADLVTIWHRKIPPIAWNYSSSNTALVYPNIQLNKTYFDLDRDTFGIKLSRSSSVYNQDSVTTASDSTCIISPMAYRIEDSSYGYYVYGFISFYSTSPGSSKIVIYFDKETNGNTLTNYIPGPGEVGFRPIREPSDGPGGGGDTPGNIPDYKSDVLEQPDEPIEDVASVANAGLVNVYVIDKTNLDNLGKCLYSTNFLSIFSNLFVNPLDAIVSLSVFPYPPYSTSATSIKILNRTCTTAQLGATALGNPLQKQFRQIDMGTLNVAEIFQSFLDYDSTDFQLYLPFIGSVDLPVSEVMNGSINVKYTIDYFTGTCVANVLCARVATLTSGRTLTTYAQHSYQGSCAVQVPLTAVSYGNIVGSLIGITATGLRAGTAAGSFKSGAVASGMSAMGELGGGGFQTKAETKGSISANAGFCAVLYPYITITRPITAEPENYQEVIGYPSYIDATLSTCSGLCVCDDIDLRGVSSATDNELNRIRQLCKDGIYI